MRPLRRRAARMARPARVRIRWRKPWFLARRRLFGWNVRLLTVLGFRQVEASRRRRLWSGDSDRVVWTGAVHRGATDRPRSSGRHNPDPGMRSAPSVIHTWIRSSRRAMVSAGETGRDADVSGQDPLTGIWPDCTTVREGSGEGQTRGPCDGKAQYRVPGPTRGRTRRGTARFRDLSPLPIEVGLSAQYRRLSVDNFQPCPQMWTRLWKPQ